MQGKDNLQSWRSSLTANINHSTANQTHIPKLWLQGKLCRRFAMQMIWHYMIESLSYNVATRSVTSMFNYFLKLLFCAFFLQRINEDQLSSGLGSTQSFLTTFYFIWFRLIWDMKKKFTLLPPLPTRLIRTVPPLMLGSTWQSSTCQSSGTS